MKTADLTGAALDWAVCRAGGGGNDIRAWKSGYWDYNMYQYSTDWSQGGPIIEREKIGVCHYSEVDDWEVPGWGAWRTDIDDRQTIAGPAPLTAAMRCYVASKLGDEVDVPKELLTARAILAPRNST